MSDNNVNIDGLRNTGYALVSRGDLDKAREVFGRICRVAENDYEAHMALGIIHGMQGDLAGAIKRLQQATDIDPGNPSGYYNLGIALKKAERPEEAADCYRKAVGIAPGNPAFNNNLGSILLDLRDMGNAISCFKKALELEPGNAEYYYNLGIAYKHSGLRTAACTAFQHAVSLDPGFTAARKFLGTVNISLGRLPEAENCFRQVLEDHPDDEEAISGLATALYRQKKTEQALTLLEPRLHKAIVSPAVALAYSRISRHTDKRAEVNRVLEAILDSGRSDLNSDSIAQIHFSLGQYHDMTGEYQQAFEHFRKGNNIRKPLEGSDAHPEPADKLIASFSRESLAAAERADSNTELPVFIVGMPRSGTSLVEQILASHPDIYGAGELDALPVLLDSIRPRAGTQSAFPESITRLERSRLTDISSRYISHLEQLDANALRITDKMPGNFLNLGYIELLFPKARVIHCKRNPLDTCLSCYFQDFDGHQYTSSLESLGNFYLQYERIMRHWNDVLNISIFEIQYENLVRNFEPACRALVEFCGVEWSDSCADFYNADRLVLTSSLDQVNRPLYNTSIERWKNYDSFIGSLKDILDSGTQSGRES